jgi:hypothetical protein
MSPVGRRPERIGARHRRADQARERRSEPLRVTA